MTETLEFLRLALIEAEKCEAVPTAFCVGCVIAVPWPDVSSHSTVLSTGYSRELEGNTHAEANALQKARSLSLEQLATMFTGHVPPSIGELLARADVYTTLEPCSIRTSGLAPCADALIEAKVHACYIGVGEPEDFVQCTGAQKLLDAGIQVIWIKGLEKECLEVARRGHDESN